jgi:hypothetical protein
MTLTNPDEWSLERIAQEQERICEGLRRMSAEDQLGYLKGRIAGLPPRVGKILETLLIETERIVMVQTETRSGLEKWERITLFIFGVFFLACLLVLAIKFPSPTEFQYRVFCVVLSLSGGGIGAVLPGLLHLESRTNNLLVRASGALAVFALIYLTICRR